MILKSIYTLAYLFLFNSIELVKSSGNQELRDTIVLKSFIPIEPESLVESKYTVRLELNISQIEEKLKSLSAAIDKMENAINSLVNDKIGVLDKNIRAKIDQIFEEKIKSVDKSLKDKLKLMDNKSQYPIHEVKCNDRLPRDCKEVNECNSNIYRIMVPDYSNDSFPVACDLKTSNGSWTIIQRRQDGTEDFYRNWTEYVKGFGNLNGEFFIGLEKLHILTTQGKPQELYIILEDFEGIRKYARYGQFKVDNEQAGYKLTVANYTGNAGDGLRIHNGNKFTTKDRDNDTSENRNCAELYRGAWWYIACHDSNLNGMYLSGHVPKSKSGQGIVWTAFRGPEYSLKFVQMMIRDKQD